MEFSVIGVFLHADLFGKFIILLLLVMSVVSWGVIIHKYLQLRNVSQMNERFLDVFWSNRSLSQITTTASGINAPLLDVFQVTHKNYTSLSDEVAADEKISFVERIIRAESLAKVRDMESSLSVLSIIASSAPYIGLLGTVWGIIGSFHTIGAMRSASLAVVAPGLSEALVATALGLFAAIPAVIFYNVFAARIKQQVSIMESFADELVAILMRRA
ncbi:MotA/TolQ/ExbB proton channel family protein [Desulfurispira natronophila]|uniref:Biopolymer transport protein TolQ n=1 Tax=Desulfurispira natronophila TaxID=682562 RepID=A0A7W7Y5W5_9BACT|nr:MotA/TolQ/ExbB proton channel family protein [Desulfurispira natronophila]MBB5022567.1 biopolymer transport protein TolQ [Desulfurispira natronophila]